MSYVHIVTVGASIASNYEKDKMDRRVPEAEIEERLSRMREAEKSQYGKELSRYLHKKHEEGRIREASAELNAITRYLKQISLVYLIHTDTNLGRCCANTLKEYLKERGVQVAEPIEIQGLHGPESFQRGLANLVREIAQILTHHKDVRICATGGFKPEVALVSVLGFIAKAPVYYIHESFRQEIHLPPLPIDWRLEVKRRGKAMNAIVAAGERGIEKNKLIENFGRETYEELRNNWLIEEKGNRCVATDVSKAILEAMLKLSKRKYARSALSLR